MKKLTVIPFLSLLLILSCGRTNYTPYDYNGAVLVAGTGGGFTGRVEEYSLLDNGQLFYGTNSEGFVDELERLDKRTVDQIFKNYSELGFGELDIDAPGNMYYYLEYRNGDINHKIKWGAYDANPPKELNIYFTNLQKVFSQRKKEFSGLKTSKK